MSNKLDFLKELNGRRALITGGTRGIAEAVALLVSDRGKFMTGATYRVDGGVTAR